MRIALHSQDGKHIIPLSLGKVETIGRDANYGVDDKFVSRKHLDVDVDANGVVSIRKVGTTNKCWYQRAGGEAVALDNGAVTLNHQDTIFLLKGKYPFVVHIEADVVETRDSPPPEPRGTKRSLSSGSPEYEPPPKKAKSASRQESTVDETTAPKPQAMDTSGAPAMHRQSSGASSTAQAPLARQNSATRQPGSPMQSQMLQRMATRVASQSRYSDPPLSQLILPNLQRLPTGRIENMDLAQAVLREDAKKEVAATAGLDPAAVVAARPPSPVPDPSPPKAAAPAKAAPAAKPTIVDDDEEIQEVKRVAEQVEEQDRRRKQEEDEATARLLAEFAQEENDAAERKRKEDEDAQLAATMALLEEEKQQEEKRRALEDEDEKLARQMEEDDKKAAAAAAQAAATAAAQAAAAAALARPPPIMIGHGGFGMGVPAVVSHYHTGGGGYGSGSEDEEEEEEEEEPPQDEEEEEEDDPMVGVTTTSTTTSTAAVAAAPAPAVSSFVPDPNKPYSLENLAKNSADFQAVSDEFAAVGFKVTKVERIHNLLFATKLTMGLQLMQAEVKVQGREFGWTVNERFLFHTTRAPKATICTSGLDERYSSAGFFGNGIYMSNDPRKCDQYWQGGHGQRYLFRCRALLGTAKVYKHGVSDRSLRVPPAGCDSVQGNMNGYDEFIVYNSMYSIPVMVVEYSHGGHASVPAPSAHGYGGGWGVGAAMNLAMGWLGGGVASAPVSINYCQYLTTRGHGCHKAAMANGFCYKHRNHAAAILPPPVVTAIASSSAAAPVVRRKVTAAMVNRVVNATGCTKSQAKAELTVNGGDEQAAIQALSPVAAPAASTAAMASAAAPAPAAAPVAAPASAGKAKRGASIAGGRAGLWTMMGAVSGVNQDCPICLTGVDGANAGEVVELVKCKHKLHKDCVDGMPSLKDGYVKCPVCNTIHGILMGDSPPGSMKVAKSRGWITIQYDIPNGIQSAGHPKPGKPFSGTSRIAYLQDDPEGRKIADLLKIAFDRRLIFTVGASLSTGQGDTVTWAGIHHKTQQHAGPFGYPDPGYYTRVLGELKDRGVE